MTTQMFNSGSVARSGKVTCLGLEFDSDDERREHFREELRQKLKDPAFRAIEGFPIGSDEDILALSDPPYYTACPNPWLSAFIAEWEATKPSSTPDITSGTKSSTSSASPYHREPFATDVSEGKNDPIYNAHSYHTKVPHKAIMRYILHYTEPGDIVFDGFCGTGMTGVAAQMCGDPKVVRELGYKVDDDGVISQKEADEEGKDIWVAFSRVGVRRAVLNDLSPAATFIAYNYNTPLDAEAFRQEAERILTEVGIECDWMYETLHTDGKTKGRINYTVWSDVFTCANCNGEIIYFNEAVDQEIKKVRPEFPCPHCSAPQDKRNLQRVWETKFDEFLNRNIKHAKQVPVLINYLMENQRGRFKKTPDEHDLILLNKIENANFIYWHPTNELPDGFNTVQPKRSHGNTHVHHFFTKRALHALGSLLEKSNLRMRLVLQSFACTLASRLVRYNLGNAGNGILPGTLYAPSLNAETDILKLANRKVGDFIKAFLCKERGVVSCQSSEGTSLKDSSIDYIFLDPPFGANIMYSELSFIWEAWLKVLTNNKPEAIQNKTQGKGLREYHSLMLSCFTEAYRILKPGRWMTVEFHNSKASVWNSIQTSLTEAGFIVANVSALDKQQGTFKAVTTSTAVKQDLIISAYKPNGGFEERFEKAIGKEEGVWEFIRSHLKYLPTAKYQNGKLHAINEREPRILFDKLVAYYVRRGLPVPMSSAEFQAGLRQRFAERDGMIFLSEQTNEYDKKRLRVDSVGQASLFIDGEASAIQWLHRLLHTKPQSFQDIHPQFLKELEGWRKNETPLELSTLLEENFIKYPGDGDVPSQIHTYLSSNWPDLRKKEKNDAALRAKAKDRWYVPDPNKAGDLEKLREKHLLKEFNDYLQATGKLKIFRLEAVRAGFKIAWQDKQYNTIIKVAELIPPAILEEDPQLLMWYDQAQTRLDSMR